MAFELFLYSLSLIPYSLSLIPCIMTFIKEKQNRVFIFLAAFFLTNAIVAEFMGVKIFSLEDTLGIHQFTFHFFGEQINGFSLTCGVILWPFVFIFTDIINEYFGTRGVRFLSIIAAVMIAYTYLMLNLAIHVTPAQWWLSKSQYGPSFNYEHAYDAVFGQGDNIIVGIDASLSSSVRSQTCIYFTGSKNVQEKNTSGCAAQALLLSRSL
jgi:hypothetical protein